MNIKFFTPAVSVLLLAACAAPEIHHHGRYDSMQPVQHTVTQVSDGVFSCENGLSVHVRQLGSGKVELRLDDKRAVLSSAVAASGERYTSENGLFGHGAEWHQKGGEAFFGFADAYGNVVETSCRIR
ncbi:MliC family protein [Neisseria cinerea]|uniref:MliC family protein n=1 Tax=Neisseria cinerea TaxID=483 RepID=A0A7T3EW93_NEICI|nr:MliC family protein [Neisseria cinerea]QPT38646.1 MliC family protein [Neisseria cinerea]SQF83524.1 lipoprotein [Neisseria cinerea]